LVAEVVDAGADVEVVDDTLLVLALEVAVVAGIVAVEDADCATFTTGKVADDA
jgi:hypothetical protein